MINHELFHHTIMIEAIKKRRAVREYLNQAIPEEKIQEILKAAMFAPSGHAKYPWEIVVVKDATTKELLSKTTPWSTFAKEAGVILAVIGNEKESPRWIEDCSIVAEHLWLEATAQDLGACWVQIRDHDNAEKDVRKILNIPAELRVLCLMAVGVPAKQPEEHTDADFEKNKIKEEKYR